MVFDTSLLNDYHYNVLIKGKWSNQGKKQRLLQQLDVVAIEKAAFGSH